MNGFWLYPSAWRAGVAGLLSVCYLSVWRAGVAGLLSVWYLSAWRAGVAGLLSVWYLSVWRAGMAGGAAGGRHGEAGWSSGRLLHLVLGSLQLLHNLLQILLVHLQFSDLNNKNKYFKTPQIGKYRYCLELRRPVLRRAENSLIGFLSELLVYCKKLANERFAQKNERFAHFW